MQPFDGVNRRLDFGMLVLNVTIAHSVSSDFSCCPSKTIIASSSGSIKAVIHVRDVLLPAFQFMLTVVVGHMLYLHGLKLQKQSPRIYSLSHTALALSGVGGRNCSCLYSSEGDSRLVYLLSAMDSWLASPFLYQKQMQPAFHSEVILSSPYTMLSDALINCTDTFVCRVTITRVENNNVDSALPAHVGCKRSHVNSFEYGNIRLHSLCLRAVHPNAGAALYCTFCQCSLTAMETHCAESVL